MSIKDWPRVIGLTLWHMPGRTALAMLRVAPPAFWAQTGAAVAMTGVFVGFGLVIWRGPWPVDRAEQQLGLLGWGMLCGALLVLVALVCIMGLKIGAALSKDGFRLDASRDDDDDPPHVTVTTTTEVTPVVQAKS